MPYRYIATAKLPTRWGTFLIHGFEDAQTQKEHVALTFGDIDQQKGVLARVHSECLTGDALFSLRCDCGPQLEAALKRIAEEGKGVLMYLRQEGRGIGLLNKIKAYRLQDAGADTVEANEQLGFEADQRSYEICRFMLDQLNIRSIRLLTNNPKKTSELEKLGITIIERLPHQPGKNPHNESYLITKQDKMGHLFSCSAPNHNRLDHSHSDQNDPDPSHTPDPE